VVQAFVVVLHRGHALLLARVIVVGAVDHVAREQLLPEGEAARRACARAKVSQLAVASMHFCRRCIEPLEIRRAMRLTPVQAVSGRHGGRCRSWGGDAEVRWKLSRALAMKLSAWTELELAFLGTVGTKPTPQLTQLPESTSHNCATMERALSQCVQPWFLSACESCPSFRPFLGSSFSIRFPYLSLL
jgi:hypothetical protein